MLQVLRNWMWLQRTQWMSRQQLTRIQAARLRETVNEAFRKVPFYKDSFEAANVPVSSISEVDDISKLPLISNMDFRKASLEKRTALDVDVSSCRLDTTSGTTGIPISILEDPYAAAYRDALMLRFLWAYGAGPFDKIARGRYLSTWIPRLAEKRGLWSFIRRRIVKQKPFVTFNDQFEFLARNKPDILVAFSSYCRELAKYCKSTGKSLKFRIVVTSGDMLDDSTRKLLKDTFQSEVFDHYGIEEVGGSIAWECPTHYGYHTNAESLILEFLHNGVPVSAGEFGELYVTCFHRKATPIIRYRAGDIARRVDGDCPCGRGLLMLREIQGRVLDYILTTDGHHISPHDILAVLTETQGLSQFKVIQKDDFSIEVRVKIDKNDPEPIIQDVQQRCKGLFEETPLDVKLVDRIDTAGPKFRVVESQATS